MEGSKISEGFQQLVRDRGDQVLIHTKVCVEWKLNHKNCQGCPSELGCGKAVAMLGVSLTPMMYAPNSYEDYERMNQSIQDKLDKILKAKSSKELRNIRI